MSHLTEHKQDAEHTAANLAQPVQQGFEVAVDAVPTPARHVAESIGGLTEAVAETIAHGAKAAAHVPSHALEVTKEAAAHAGHLGGQMLGRAAETVKNKVQSRPERRVVKRVKAAHERAERAERAEREARNAAKMAAITAKKAQAKLTAQAAKAAAKHKASEESALKSVKSLEKQMASRMKSHEVAIHDLELKVGALAKRRPRKSGGNGLLWLLVLAGGGYYLARNPSVRRKIRETAEKFSPQVASSLHSASRSARQIIGEVWIERDESSPAASAADGKKA
ncbi:hypothetical protein [Deinococcus yavapaiensis]|uniref:Transcription factor-like protein n=1 Tax=Deinococcus yavapaiensis KR-236 TaxID=694435 RepID=A0A318S1H7_9DEIO|nr:hypothetical protein [Deinococcus yavapaiensis]PYE48391.1 transcription factor-like protein [Deinococcus yavapaiensis KR-236]